MPIKNPTPSRPNHIPDQPVGGPSLGEQVLAQTPDFRPPQPYPDGHEAIASPKTATQTTDAVGATAISRETPAGTEGGFLASRWQAVKAHWQERMPTKANWQERTPLFSLKARLPEGVELTRGETAKAVVHEVATAAPIRYAVNLFFAKLKGDALSNGPHGDTFKTMYHVPGGSGPAAALRETGQYQRYNARYLKREAHAYAVDNPVTRVVLKRQVAVERHAPTSPVTDHLRTLPLQVIQDSGLELGVRGQERKRFPAQVIPEAPAKLGPRPAATRARLRKPATS